MKADPRLDELKQFAEVGLFKNILPFWRTQVVDDENGGFFGEISNDLVVNKKASKGLILNARILWTFSSAYQFTNENIDKSLAQRAFEYICQFFYDDNYGGYYWTVTFDGTPHETKKQIYALAFAMYGMSEYYKISNNLEALDRSIELFQLIESKSFDKERNGYFEAYARDWSETGNLRLSDKDMNEKKTMNTHLHILEAYANLYSLWKDQRLADKLKNLVLIFLNEIISPEDFHLNLFFNEEWECKSTVISYGHDIEAGWLLYETALKHGDGDLIKELEKLLPEITDASLEGLSEIGGLYHEGDRAGLHRDFDYEWWPQAEALVGLLNTYQVTGNEIYLDRAIDISRFINKYIIDHENGEWFYRVDRTGKPVNTYPKAGLWKCPYHNSRACLELIKRIGSLTQILNNESNRNNLVDRSYFV